MDKAKENHAKIGAFVLRLFPTMMQLILKDNIPPGRLKRIFIDKTFSIILTDADIDLMKMLPNSDDFTIEICYKILRFENLIREPKCKWGNIPHDTEVGIADDIQRILNFSNEVISKTSQEITTIYHENKFEDTVKQIVKRVDEYLRSDDCKKMYQHLHNQKIDTSEVLDKLTHTQHIQVVPSTLTTKMKTIMREFYSRTALVVTEIFPDILRNIIQSRISARDLYRKFDKAFYSSCWPEQQNLLKKLKHDNSFSSLDIPTTYRLLRYFSLIPPPSNGWGTDPALTDIVISDDVERIRKLRNKIAHSFDATISKSDFDTFFVRCCEIGGRIDQYFNKQTSFKQKIVDCKICLMDTEMQTKYEKAVKELENLKLHYERKPLKFYWGDSFENNLKILRLMLKEEKIEGNQTYRVQIILQTESDMNDSTISILNFLKEEINEGLAGIEFVFALPGSVILCVDILVEKLERDEKLLLSLYVFLNKIIQTGVIGDPFTENMDVVLIPSDENTFYDMAKKNLHTLSTIELNFDIAAFHLATNEKIETALRDIFEDVHKKSSSIGIKGDIRAKVMPLQLDFHREKVTRLREADVHIKSNSIEIQGVPRSTDTPLQLAFDRENVTKVQEDHIHIKQNLVGLKGDIRATDTPLKPDVTTGIESKLREAQEVKTDLSMSLSLMLASEKIEIRDGYRTYYVKPRGIHNIDMDIRCCNVLPGYDDDIHQEKTIILIGPTGVGKSTMIHAMVKYIAGVSFLDQYSFKLSHLTEEEKIRKKRWDISQTDGITCYRVPWRYGSAVNFKLCVIDTPGFCDSRGSEFDKATPEMFKNLFKKRIQGIDALCFVVPVSCVRLTHTQKYIFTSILELFANDISENIFLFLTFDDGATGEPTPLCALRSARIPFKDDMYFLFNNANVFKEESSEDVWITRAESFSGFFNKLKTTNKMSLANTKAVLETREFLEMKQANILKTIGNQVTDIMNIKQDKKNIAEHEEDIENNKDFTKSYQDTKTDTITETREELTKRYDVAKEAAEGRTKMMNTNKARLKKSLEELDSNLKQVAEKIEILQLHALRPNFESMEDFLDKVIDREKMPLTDKNFDERVEILTTIRKLVLSNVPLTTMMKDF